MTSVWSARENLRRRSWSSASCSFSAARALLCASPRSRSLNPQPCSSPSASRLSGVEEGAPCGTDGADPLVKTLTKNTFTRISPHDAFQTSAECPRYSEHVRDAVLTVEEGVPPAFPRSILPVLQKRLQLLPNFRLSARDRDSAGRCRHGNHKQ